ncbi:MAG: SH3 domain-containing protein [Bacteroidota bacterium]
MRKILFLLFIQVTSIYAQTELLVLAKSGLNVRINSDLQSEKIGKFIYAEKVEVLKKTNKFLNITDNGKIIKGEWYKVKGKSQSNEIITGYVFSSFLTKPKQKDIFEFINYDDNFDYSLLNTKKGDTLYSFINDNNDDRSYLRGDSIEIEWKEDLIYIAGNGDTKEIDDWIISTKKIKDGKVSDFRKNYNREIKYYYTENYAQSFLNDIYLIVENYIVNSKNELIKNLIKERRQLEFSIEDRKRNDLDYLVLGIGHSIEHKISTIQWLYYNNDTGRLYEYDLPNDKLIEYKY